MNLREIVEIFDINGIEYDKSLPELLRLGYDGDGCQSVGEEILDALGEIASRGVNAGFNRSMKDAVLVLTKIASKLSRPKAEKKAETYRTQAEQARAATKFEEEQGMESIKREVYGWIDTSIAGAESILGSNFVGSRREVLEESISRLREIRSIVEHAPDDSSQSALDFATGVVGGIAEWRAVTSELRITEYTLRSLESAREYAEKWDRLREATKKRDRVTEKDLVESKVKGNYRTDRMGRIADSKEVLANIRTFEENFRTYHEQAKVDFDTTELERELDEKNAELRALRREMESGLRDKFNAGEITKDELIRTARRTKERIPMLEDAARDLERDIETRERRMQDAEATVRVLRNVHDAIGFYEHSMDLGAITQIGKIVDFRAIFRILSGSGSARDVNDVLFPLRAGMEVEEEGRRIRNELIEGKRKIDEELDASRVAAGGRNRAEERAAREREDEEIFNSIMGGGDGGGEEEETASRVDPVRIEEDK